MALIIENGTGMTNADSFATLAQADTFWSQRLIPAWAAKPEADREAALRMAATYMAIAYTWPGQPKVAAQALCWPRAGAFDDYGVEVDEDAVPAQVVAGQILLAFEALTTNLLSNVTPEPALARKSVKIGSLAIDRSFDTVRQPAGLPRFPAADAVLAPISVARGSSSGFRMSPLSRG